MLLVILFALFFIALYYMDKCNKKNLDAQAIIFFIASLIAGGALIFGIFLAGFNYISKDIKKAKMREEYHYALYRKESNSYYAMDWNRDLAVYKAGHENIWLGVFYPVDCDQFDFIAYD